MHMAHRLYKPGFRWGDIVAHAWYFEHFRQWLRDGVVTFSYFKQDRSIREAKGTLNPLIIPEEDKPKGIVNRHPNYAQISYYDLERKAWRSFRITDFIGFVTIYEIKRTSAARRLIPGEKEGKGHLLFDYRNQRCC